MKDKDFECNGCGAILTFLPGTDNLVCQYCGAENKIKQVKTKIEELNYYQYLEEKFTTSSKQEIRSVKCKSCAAEFSLSENITADRCPFCESTIVLTNEITKKMIKPQSLLPFSVTQKQAQIFFRKWIKSLWFAPNKLKKYAKQVDGLQGVYVPYWTYDANTSSSYSGQRGTYYYVTERYTTTEDGKTVTRTRQVRKTRWRSVRGNVQHFFDDVLVIASTSLPIKYAEELEPWDLKKLVPYKDDYLSGFRAESYQIGLKNGFDNGKVIMDVTIRNLVRNDIGGDDQRINQVNTGYSNITFKHILLPIWITSYRFQNKVFQILVNARTGEVQGERPWSWIKITFAVIFALIIIGVGLYFYQEYN